jgi:hypothetical protein
LKHIFSCFSSSIWRVDGWWLSCLDPWMVNFSGWLRRGVTFYPTNQLFCSRISISLFIFCIVHTLVLSYLKSQLSYLFLQLSSCQFFSKIYGKRLYFRILLVIKFLSLFFDDDWKRYVDYEGLWAITIENIIIGQIKFHDFQIATQNNFFIKRGKKKEIIIVK